nr:hypothetical protein [Paenibacillus spongiae]
MAYDPKPELSIVSEKYDTILNLAPQVDSLSFDFEGAFRNEVAHFIDSTLGL